MSTKKQTWTDLKKTLNEKYAFTPTYGGNNGFHRYRDTYKKYDDQSGSKTYGQFLDTRTGKVWTSKYEKSVEKEFNKDANVLQGAKNKSTFSWLPKSDKKFNKARHELTAAKSARFIPIPGISKKTVSGEYLGTVKNKERVFKAQEALLIQQERRKKERGPSKDELAILHGSSNRTSQKAQADSVLNTLSGKEKLDAEQQIETDEKEKLVSVKKPNIVSSTQPALTPTETEKSIKKVVETKVPPIEDDGGRQAWLDKSANSPAARAGFSDDERWALQQQHRKWLANRGKTKSKPYGAMGRGQRQ